MARMTAEVILDTNIIIYLSEGKFNIHYELERLLNQHFKLVILSPCVTELEFLAAKERKMQKHLSFLRKLAEQIPIIPYHPEKIPTTDEKIIAYAKERPPEKIVITNDLELKKKLRAEGIPVIYVRKKSHLEVLGL